MRGTRPYLFGIAISRYCGLMLPNEPITYIGRTNTRANYRAFGIKQSDRFSHTFIIGRTGTGKTTLIETMALQDIWAGRGLAVLDPHGDLVERLVAQIPESRKADLVYLNAPDPHQPYGYNPLRRVSIELVPLVASGLLDAFKKIWRGNEWGVRMEHVLRNCLFALLEKGDAILPDILRLISDTGYRATVVRGLKNEQVKQFWTNEFPKYDPRYRQDMIAPIQNKLSGFVSDPRIRRILTGGEKDIRIREIFDTKKIFLVNLAKGALGDDSARLLGAILISTMALAAFSRIDTPEIHRSDFILYADEFQSYTSLAVANMVSELRKFRVGLVAAQQILSQSEPEVRHALLGNVGTLIAFRIGAEDAMVIGKEFAPDFEPVDLISIPNFTCYLRLMINRAPSKPFSATTLTPAGVAQILGRNLSA